MNEYIMKKIKLKNILIIIYIVIAILINAIVYDFCFNLQSLANQTSYEINPEAGKIQKLITTYYENKAPAKSLVKKIYNIYIKREGCDYLLVISGDKALHRYLSDDFGMSALRLKYVSSIDKKNIHQHSDKSEIILSVSDILPIYNHKNDIGKMCLTLLTSNLDPPSLNHQHQMFLAPYKKALDDFLSSREYPYHQEFYYSIFIAILALTLLPVFFYIAGQLTSDDSEPAFQKKDSKHSADSKYKIIKKLYKKGMFTEIHLAHDIERERDVVIKNIKKEFENDRNIKMMMTQEFNVLEKHKHLNIIEVYLFEKKIDKYRNCIVMEYIRGETLTSLMKSLNKPMDVEYVIHIIINICEGLKKIHSEGIFHKDITPSNVMISKEGRIIVIDFGCSQLSSETKVVPKGTEGYLSPEHREDKNIDQQSDIYSLGIIFYEMLCGKRIKFDQNQRLKPIIEIVNHLPQGIIDVVMKCLEPKKEDRYSAVDDIINTLSDLSSNLRIHRCTKDDMAMFMRQQFP